MLVQRWAFLLDTTLISAIAALRTMTITRFLAVSAFVFLFLEPYQSRAQVSYSRFEVGVQTSSRAVGHGTATNNEIGVGGHCAYNFSRVFALDAQFDFYPWNEVPFLGTGLQEGGRGLALV